MALADQHAHHDLGSVNSAIYRIGRSSSYHTAFHDVTTGNSRYKATRGWDPVTGWEPPTRRRSPPCWPLHQPQQDMARITQPPGV